MKYEIVYSVNEDFAEAVKTVRSRMELMLSRGWKPQGGIAVTTLGQLGTAAQAFSVTQAVVHDQKGLGAVGDYWSESADKLRAELAERGVDVNSPDPVIISTAGEWFAALDGSTQDSIIATMRALSKP